MGDSEDNFSREQPHYPLYPISYSLRQILNIQDVVKVQDSSIFVYCLRGTRSRRTAGKLKNSVIKTAIGWKPLL